MTKFKKGDKVILVKHDDESGINLDIGDKGRFGATCLIKMDGFMYCGQMLNVQVGGYPQTA